MNTKTLFGFIIAIVVLGGAMWFINRSPGENGTNEPPPPPPPPTEVLKKNFPILLQNAAGPPMGNPKAPWTIIECGDFQCPNCGKARPTLEKFVNSSGGKVKLYFVNYPLTMIHKHAMDAAEASLAASAQGKFWPMYNLLYSNQDSLVPSEIEYNASQIPGLDTKQFSADLKSHKYAQEAGKQLQLCVATGIMSTPTFLVRASDDPNAIPKAYVGYMDYKKGPASLSDLVKSPPWQASSAVVTAKAVPAASPGS